MTTTKNSQKSQAIADLHDRAIFQLSGPDAQLYLNGQVSQDVRLATYTVAVYSIASNFKGKLQGDFYIRKFNDVILIDTDSSQCESLFNRLDKYLIADDAELTDVSDQYSLAFSTGSTPPDVTNLGTWSVQRFGVDGLDYLLEKGASIPNSQPEGYWEETRISNGVPKWNHELDDTVLPPEADLDITAVSYTKGCYTGQEVISRMKSSGKKNRHLVQFSSEQDVAVPQDLFANVDDTKPAGTICSIVKTENNWIGLGYRTRKHEAATDFVTSDGAKVVISE